MTERSSASTPPAPARGRPPKAKPRGRSGSARKPPQLKLQILLPDGTKLGPGKVSLLELIDSEGSLSRAAARMRMSYRRAWLFMSQINAAFDEISVATPEGGHGGGPAQLTPFGRDLIHHYRRLEADAQNAVAGTLDWLGRHRAAKSDPSSPAGGAC